jgi:hypothetical protein
MAISEQAITTLTPLLFLVVLELSSIARKIDLSDVVEEEHGFLLFPDSEMLEGKPKLGRFNFIHGANTILLSFGLILIVNSGSEISVLLGVLTWVIWVLLPVVEVEDYGALLARNISYSSLQLHIISVTVASGYIAGYDAIKNSINFLVPNPINGENIPYLILVLLLYSSAYLFLSSLESEFKEYNNRHSG